MDSSYLRELGSVKNYVMKFQENCHLAALTWIDGIRNGNYLNCIFRENW
jgi:hypothetical protein